ncbi:AAA family ATPase [Microscilla marina]|uniref:Serine/threonine kinase with GAF domain n=1 Tax=Microscilla marina ATCC 23134 TaxID=313606 RepID=A1ZCG0_MICM2|nr:AAA family ATPase [Microscilla marina]EAY31962.1 serine/threonine kinase with GAF domain [Microscilla marina ATCC 23134]
MLSTQGTLLQGTLLYESPSTKVYCQKTDNGENQVVVKVLSEEFPSSEKLVQFNNEYHIVKNLNIPGIRKVFKKEKVGDYHALFLEYIQGQKLGELCNSQPVSLSSFLHIAIQLAHTLGELHQQHVIHKDINPNNVIVDKDKQAYIIDFGIAAKINLKTTHLGNPKNLEGTLPYISPEQTGRMNRIIDYRTDLYSLGATFYELLTGKTPFESTDSLELIHAHIAKPPLPPKHILNDIPKVVSDIVLKLLAKNAEDRYQSAYGLKHDLQRCIDLLNTKAKVPYFAPAQNDYSGKFQIPQKLYGRSHELDILMQSFRLVSEGKTQMVLVAGYSGVGKSALINEIHKPITEKSGNFIKGKYDQYQRDVPYFAIIQAIKEFVNSLLTNDPEYLNAWKKNILAAIGTNGKVLTEVIPALELIIGVQPEVPTLGLSESQSRFNYTFRRFIKAIAHQDHPLVIFIDDLQWADAASLMLLRDVAIDEEVRYLMLIGAYRNNEVDEIHPLAQLLKATRQELASTFKAQYLQEITIEPLLLEDIATLLVDTLNAPLAQVQDFAQLIHKKTAGNAFFINQFLLSLYEQKFLQYSFESKTWQWNLDNIRGLNITDNVVELMTQKIQKLSKTTQETLQFAACIGNLFNIHDLAIVCKSAQSKIATHLQQAMLEGLIFPADNQYKLAELVEELPTQNDLKIIYRFAHDRIQQAVYSLIPEQKKQVIHKDIGELLLQSIPESTWSKHIFDIVNHLNYGSLLIDQQEEKINLASLNLKAAQKAKASAAFTPALHYAQKGIELLPPDGWQSHNEMMQQLHAEAAEASFLASQFEQTISFAQDALQHSEDVLDKIRIYEVLIYTYDTQKLLEKALETALKALKELGISLPAKPGVPQVLGAIVKTKRALPGKKVLAQAQKPAMMDAQRLAAMKILSSMSSTAYRSNPELYVLITLLNVRLSVKYGNAPQSPFGFATYGAILNGALGDVKTATAAGKLSLELLTKFSTAEHLPKVYMAHYTAIAPWITSMHDVMEKFDDAARVGLEVGDLNFTPVALTVKLAYHYMIGTQCSTVESEANKAKRILQRINSEGYILWYNMYLQVIGNLQENTEKPYELSGKIYQEKDIKFHIEAGDKTVLHAFYTFKLSLAYLFEAYDEGLTYIKDIKPYMEGGLSQAMMAMYCFYASLNYLSLCDTATNAQTKKYLRKSKKLQGKLRKWAKNAAMNYEHRYLLIEAERMRVLRNDGKAGELYNKAIALSRSNGFMNHHALANELAGKFYHHKGAQFKHLTTLYINQAYKSYKYWGATAKVNLIEQKYKQYLVSSAVPTVMTTSASLGTISATGNLSKALDLNSVMKASQALSSEIVLGQLLEKVMKVVIENAGAQRGVLLLSKNDQLLIEAESNVDNTQVEVLQSIPIEQVDGLTENPKLSSKIVNYVVRTQKSLVLNNASKEGAFTQLQYVKKCKPKSILCLPLLNQGRLIGVLYLENPLSIGAFTPDHLEVLNLLSSQMAISIENALFYESLEDKVKERTLKLSLAYDEIEDKNKNITASINYARRIQHAMLPRIDTIKACLPDSFVLFKPRDIVSGDFYFFADVQIAPNHTKSILAAIDCTGHGVPGAFMSMIGNEILKEIIEFKKITQADQILNKLHNGINAALRQEETSNRDGMDMALCVIDQKQRTVEFSGAKNPLLYVRGNVLHEIKGSKLPVGGFQKEWDRDFEASVVTLTDEPTSFYMFSDGYADQFGGELGKKFMKKYFKKLLVEVHQRPMEEQHHALDHNLKDWMNNKHAQIDDILVVGFKL